MSERESGMPSREAIMSVIGTLEGSGDARPDQADRALLEMTAERDAWRAEAEALRAVLAQQLDAIRAGLSQQFAETAQLRADVTQHLAVTDRILAAPPAGSQAAAPARHLRRVAAAAALAIDPAQDVVEAPSVPMAIPSLAPDETPAHAQRRLGTVPVALVNRPDAEVSTSPDPVRSRLHH